MRNAESYAGRLAADSVAIFLFHGVVEQHESRIRNYTRKHIDQRRFDKILRALRRNGQPVSMDDIARANSLGSSLPPRSFAITFDDGFLNNFQIAAPILVDHEIPATFYVTTGFIGTNRMSWIDRIEFAFEGAAAGSLSLPWGKRSFRSTEEAISLLSEIRREVKSTPGIDPEHLASKIQAQLDYPETFAAAGPLDAKMSWEQTITLGSDPLFTIGGHSHTHAVLSFLDDDQLAFEVDTSISLLRSHGFDSRHYSYPEGMTNCYSEKVISSLRDKGVKICPTAEDGVNELPCDLFRLRRVTVT